METDKGGIPLKRNKLHIWGCIILFLILLVLLIISFNQKLYSKKCTAAQYEIYIVSPGDTLWSISKRYVKGDPRGLVYEIKKTNSIGSYIYPGQELKVPVGMEVRK